MTSKYKRLVVVARDPQTDIWIGDDEGNFVQKANGRLETHLLPGSYIVEFGLGKKQHWIELSEDVEFTEK